MLNVILNLAKRVVLYTSLLLFFTAILISGYQTSHAETPSALAIPPVQLCGTSDLKLGMVGADVLELQQYLNNNGFLVALSGFGAPGQETTYFGELTKNALTKLQVTNNIPATQGVFDSLTKSF